MQKNGGVPLLDIYPISNSKVVVIMLLVNWKRPKLTTNDLKHRISPYYEGGSAKKGSPLADVSPAAISPPWDFLSKVLIFSRFLGKGEAQSRGVSN